MLNVNFVHEVHEYGNVVMNVWWTVDGLGWVAALSAEMPGHGRVLGLIRHGSSGLSALLPRSMMRGIPYRGVSLRV
jgi:hypothetical protein